MPEKRTDTADISFVIKAVIYWLLTAIPALLLASAVPSRFMRKIVCRLRLNEVSRQ